MSYDLFVFDPGAAPRGAEALDAWFVRETESEETSDDPAVAAASLQAWFADANKVFPALNGPAAPDNAEDLPNCGDYNIGPNSIYVSFGWSQAEFAAKEVTALAAKHKLGLFDPQRSGESGWYFPIGGTLSLLEELEPRRGFLRVWFGRLRRSAKR